MKLTPVLLIFAITATVSAGAQPAFQHGDVIVSTLGSGPSGPFSFTSRLLVYSGPAQWREIGVTTSDSFRETFVRDGVLYVARQTGVYRVDGEGRVLSQFINGWNVVYMAPSLDGGVVASNGSGLLFRFNTDGSVRAFQDHAGGRGMDLAADQCTAVFATRTRPAVWNACVNSAPVPFGSTGPGPAGRALRLLWDTSFLVAFMGDIVHYNASGQIIRTYGIPGEGLAIDVDGTSFWTGAGGNLVKVDIATGQILHNEFLGAGAILYLGVVGEPRAGVGSGAGISIANVPTLSRWMLLIFAAALATFGLMKLS